jgi:hypothetical protein
MSGSPDVPALRSDHSASRDYHFAFRQVTNIPYLARLAMLLHPFPRRIPGRAWLAAFGTKSRNFPHFEALFRTPSTPLRRSDWFRLAAEPARLREAEVPFPSVPNVTGLRCLRTATSELELVQATAA